MFGWFIRDAYAPREEGPDEADEFDEGPGDDWQEYFDDPTWDDSHGWFP